MITDSHEQVVDEAWFQPAERSFTRLAARFTQWPTAGPGVTADRTLRNHRMRHRTDAHKYYAYPLGALTAVAVDAPLSIAGTAATVAIGVVSLPIGLTYRLVESCTSQETESPPERNVSSWGELYPRVRIQRLEHIAHASFGGNAFGIHAQFFAQAFDMSIQRAGLGSI